jgi:dephospho-CoA kinase
MTELVLNKIKQSLHATDGLYHRLLLLTGESGSGKTDVLHKVADDLGTSVININLALSHELLDMTARQRSLRAASILDQIVDNAGSPVVLDNLEILFD